jgi:hypothetical protein
MENFDMIQTILVLSLFGCDFYSEWRIDGGGHLFDFIMNLDVIKSLLSFVCR